MSTTSVHEPFRRIVDELLSILGDLTRGRVSRGERRMGCQRRLTRSGQACDEDHAVFIVERRRTFPGFLVPLSRSAGSVAPLACRSASLAAPRSYSARWPVRRRRPFTETGEVSAATLIRSGRRTWATFSLT